jgi:hypothetical protein
LACWNPDSVHGRKMELDHFLDKHWVDICLLTENHLRSGQVFRLANYVCHRTDRPTEGGGTAILVRRGTDHYAIPVPALTQMEATVIHVILVSGPVKILAAYISPSRPLIEADLSVCLTERRASRPDGGGPERQALGLEFEANHDKGQAPACLRQ